MTASLDGSWAKFRRARAQLKVLHNDIARFLQENNPVGAEGKLDSETRTHTTRAHIDVHPDWIAWGLQLGDVIHNARASLDHAVWQLVILNGGDPTKRRTQFPVCSSGQIYWSKTKDGRPSTRDRDLAGVAEAHRAIIDDAQPYRSRDPPKDHALSGLSYLSNVDKHQVIHAGFFKMGEPDAYAFDAEVAGNIGELIDVEVHSGPFQEDTDILTMRFSGEPDGNVKMQIDIPVDVAFSERAYTVEQIHHILDAVEYILLDIATVF